MYDAGVQTADRQQARAGGAAVEGAGGVGGDQRGAASPAVHLSRQQIHPSGRPQPYHVTN